MDYLVKISKDLQSTATYSQVVEQPKLKLLYPMAVAKCQIIKVIHDQVVFLFWRAFYLKIFFTQISHQSAQFTLLFEDYLLVINFYFHL
jgi:hypothetical protein